MTAQEMAAPGPPAGVTRTPRSVDVDLTARCNLRCTYCYFFDNPAVEYQDLPTETWLPFFEECGRLGVMSLTLAGGGAVDAAGPAGAAGAQTTLSGQPYSGGMIPCAASLYW